MITLGVDLAAEPRSTAVAVIDWREGAVTLTETGASDDRIVELGASADRIGVDCPLGWPDAFVEFVVRHRDALPVAPADSIAARRGLAYRVTDLELMARGLRPLSVAADRIAHAAFRCAGLLGRLAVTDRSGAGRVAETYPAGTLRRWQLYRAGYKTDSAVRAELAGGLLAAAGLSPLPLRTDHELDAVVCALVARAAQLDLLEPIPRDRQEIARREGWIRLPACRPDQLRSSVAATR